MSDPPWACLRKKDLGWDRGVESKKAIQHVYLVGAKSMGAYGGYETFVYIKGSKTAKGHTASCSVVLGCFATYWVAKGNSCYLMGSSQNATNAL